MIIERRTTTIEKYAVKWPPHLPYGTKLSPWLSGSRFWIWRLISPCGREIGLKEYNLFAREEDKIEIPNCVPEGELINPETIEKRTLKGEG